MRILTRASACILALLAGVSAMAAQADRPAVGPVPDWVLPPPADATASPDNTPLQVLMNDQQVRITTESVDTYVVSRLKIQSPQGLSAIGTLTFAWNPDSDEMTVHRLTATRGGETLDLLGNGDDFTILRREDQLEQAVLTGMLTAVLQPPGLRVGDVLEVSYTLSRRDPVVRDTPDRAFMWTNSTLPNARFRALWPDAVPVRWRATSHMPEADHVQQDGWHELTYRMQDLGPLLQPTGAPARYSALRMVELTTFDNWQALSARLAPLYTQAAKFAPSSPLRAEVDRIRREHTKPEDRAAAALRFVQDEIRYVLLAMNTGGLVPATPDETWERRFGDCKAKSTLLLAMLRELGIDAEVVAVSTSFGDGLDARLPAVGLFDHVLVRARIGGQTYWLDGTRLGDRSLARLRPPAYFWALPLTVRGSELVAIAREPLQEPQTVVEVDIDAREGVNLPAPFKAEMRVRGDAALGLKLGVDAQPEAAREEGLREFWRQGFHGLEVDTVESRFDESTGEMIWSATGMITMEWDPQYNTYLPHDMELGYRADLARPRGTDAEAPYLVAFPSYTRNVERIRLPPQREPFFVTGTDINRDIAGGEYRRKAQVKDNVFTAESSYRSVAPEFPASQRAEVERVLLEMSRNDLYLKKPANYLPTAKELAAVAGEPQESVQDHLARAAQMQQRGMLADSLDELAAALKLEPGNMLARYGRAETLMRLGRRDEALAETRAGLAVRPSDPNLSHLQALILMAAGEWRQALQILQLILPTEMTSTMYASRGRAYARLDQDEKALADFDAAIAKSPKGGLGHMEKVMLLHTRGRDAEIPAVLKALHDANDDPLAGAKGAATLARLAGLRELAREYVDKEIALGPGASAYLMRAELLSAKEDIVADVASALAQADVTIVDQVNAAKTLLQRGWSQEAVELLGRYDADKGLMPKALGLKAIARYQTGDETGASEDFQRARERAAEDGVLLNDLCWDKATYDVLLEEALVECDAAIRLRPDCAACLDSRGFVLLRMGRFRDSIDAYNQALNKAPRQAASLYGRGLARIRNGDSAGGQKDVDAAVALSAAVRETFENAGMRP